MTASRQRILFRCGVVLPDRRPCPVRFSWLGPARERHTQDDEHEDAASAMRRAMDLGWSFDREDPVCPRHQEDRARG